MKVTHFKKSIILLKISELHVNWTRFALFCLHDRWI